MSKTKKAEKAQDIEAVASDFQSLMRQSKELEAKIKPLKAQLLAHAEENKAKFDDAFQLKFDCGAFVSLRVKDALNGEKESKAALLAELGNEYAEIELDEAKVLTDATSNDRVRKLLTKHNLVVAQKETLAVYAQ